MVKNTLSSSSSFSFSSRLLSVFLGLIYVVTRLIFLGKLPIFNDEAIYLDWGWRSVNIPGDAFFSLFDGKQPLLMWIFGYAQKCISDPVLAGRLVSVVCGGITLLGVYRIAEKFFSKKLAFWSVCVYIVVPVFVFFDRQALMESAVAAVGTWILFFFLDVLHEKRFFSSLLLGLLIGVGFFIKSSMLIFVLSMMIIFLWYIWRTYVGERVQVTALLLIAAAVSQLVVLPLYLQPDFTNIFTMNNRFTLTVGELVNMPTMHWGINVTSSVEIMWWHLTPGVFLLTVLGCFSLLDDRSEKHLFRKIIGLWFLTGLLFFVFTIRAPSARYLVALLPLTSILSTQGFFYLVGFFSKETHKHLPSVLMLINLFLPSFVTLILLLSPLQYFSLYERFTKFSQRWEYVTGWPAGYGVQEAREYVRQSAGGLPLTLLWLRPDHGNPESAMLAYFHNNPQVLVTYLDPEKLYSRVESPRCDGLEVPVLYVSRDNQMMDLEQFFIEEKRFYKPDGKNYVGVYKLKDFCPKR